MDSLLFFQQMINGFSLGSMYALIAIGYTMVYGVLRLINFAHGDIMMVGAYCTLFSMTSLNLPFVFALLFAVTMAIILGVSIDMVAYKPLRKAPRISLLITAIGVSFLLENTFQVIFGATPRKFDVPEFFTQIVDIAHLFILYKTKYGIAIRALAFDITTVHLMGINANFIISIVFCLGSALAAVGGVFWAVSYPSIDPLMGILIGLKAFAAAVLGGIGSVVGAVLGGFIIGFTEVVAVAFLPELAGFKDAFAYIFLILVLLFKPTGILGINFEKSRF